MAGAEHQEYCYTMKWHPGWLFIHWEVECRPRAGERPHGKARFVASGRSFSLDGATVRAARVIRRERARQKPKPERTLAEGTVLSRADAIARSRNFL